MMRTVVIYVSYVSKRISGKFPAYTSSATVSVTSIGIYLQLKSEAAQDGWMSGFADPTIFVSRGIPEPKVVCGRYPKEHGGPASEIWGPPTAAVPLAKP